MKTDNMTTAQLIEEKQRLKALVRASDKRGSIRNGVEKRECGMWRRSIKAIEAEIQKRHVQLPILWED